MVEQSLFCWQSKKKLQFSTEFNKHIVKAFLLHLQSFQFFRAAFLAVVISVLSVSSGLAIPLAKYRENIQEAGYWIEDLIYLNEKERAAQLNETIKKVRTLLPLSQKVESGNGASIEVNNAWLESKLKELIAPESKSKQEQILTEIAEQLLAIDNRLEEFETAQAVNLSKNDDKQKLGEILKRPEFQKPEKSLWQRWWDEFWKNWGKREPEIEPPAPAVDLSGLASIFRFVVIALAIALTGFILWRFVLPMFGKNRSVKKPRKKEPRVILGEQIAAEASARDLLTEADNLARSGDIRGAIRKGYIAVLCDLSDRKILGLARHKTNRDYLRDVRKRTEIFHPLQVLTGSFERHWYGAIPANEQDWQEFRTNYTQTVSKN